ncbi:MAG: tungstate ABC transporter substrate-binding protein WtpA [bacterium]
MCIRTKFWINRVGILILSLLLVSSCRSSHKSKKELIIFHAGSLAVPMQELVREFKTWHPQINILRESSGSRMAARKVSELGKQADVLALSDFQVFDDLLMPEHVDWYIKFACNRMVIAYTQGSKYANEINSQNWYKILLRKGVNYGYSDPNLDPCGYRTLMVWQLADLYYGEEIFSKLKAGCPKNNIRPSEVGLLALLESLALDYAFEYQSIAIQHNLKYIQLPEEIDMSNPALASIYKQAKVEVSGKESGKKSIVIGSPIVYGISIPKDAPHYEDAVEFVKFALSQKGQEIFQKNGQSPLVPWIASDMKRIPQELMLSQNPT